MLGERGASAPRAKSEPKAKPGQKPDRPQVVPQSLHPIDPPLRPLDTFEQAKRSARDVVYADFKTTFYCGCSFIPTGRSGGTIDATLCGYQPRKNAERGRRLEWEHVVPAYFFGRDRACWTEGNSECVRSDGKPYRGRACCARVDGAFRQMEADLHNLVPAVGELNGDRSNLPFGIVKDGVRQHGACNFYIGGEPRVTQPRREVKGDASRIWFYMSDAYRIRLSEEKRKLFDAWSGLDPVDDWERLRDARIEAIQGNRNPYVHGHSYTSPAPQFD